MLCYVNFNVICATSEHHICNQHLKLPHYQQNLCMREMEYLSLIFTQFCSDLVFREEVVLLCVLQCSRRSSLPPLNLPLVHCIIELLMELTLLITFLTHHTCLIA